MKLSLLPRFESHSLGWLTAVLLLAAAPWVPAQSAPVFLGSSLLPNGHGRFTVQLEPNQEHSFLVSENLRDWSTVMVFESTSSVYTVISPEPLAAMEPMLFFRAATGRVLSYDFWLQFEVQGGTFAGGTSPVVSFPVGIHDYRANFAVGWDTNPPPFNEVRFTGPTGSGLSSTPASEQYEGNDEIAYASPMVTAPAWPPAGSWSIEYKTSTHILSPSSVPGPEHLVIPLPTVTLSSGQLVGVSWTYRDPGTGAIVAAPAFVAEVYLQIEGDDGSGLTTRIYESDGLAPGTGVRALDTPVLWADVDVLILAYDDTVGHHYVCFYQKP